MTELEKLLLTIPESGYTLEQAVSEAIPGNLVPFDDTFSLTIDDPIVKESKSVILVVCTQNSWIDHSMSLVVDPETRKIKYVVSKYDSDCQYSRNSNDYYLLFTPLSEEEIDNGHLIENLNSKLGEFQNTRHLNVYKDFALNLLKPILDEVHGENYDLQIKDGSLHVLIRYPLVTITNRDESSRDIEELYCVLVFNSEFKLTDFQGFRAKFNFLDVKTKYAHSHLNSRDLSNLFRVTKFCTGSTVLTILINDFNESFNSDRFDLLLYQIDNFVRYESIEGTPYRYLSNTNNDNLRVLDSPSVSPQDVKNEALRFFEDLAVNSSIYQPMFSTSLDSDGNLSIKLSATHSLARALSPYSRVHSVYDEDHNVFHNIGEQYDDSYNLQEFNRSLENTTYKTFRNTPINYEAEIKNPENGATETEFCSQELYTYVLTEFQNKLKQQYELLQAKDLSLPEHIKQNLVSLS